MKTKDGIKKKRSIAYLIAIIIFLLISFIPRLPVMIYLPGDVKKIDSIIEIDGQYESEGEFYSNSVLVITKPSPFVYYFTKIFQNTEEFDISKTEQILSNEEMEARDQEAKKNSIYSAIIVAYERAGKPLDYDINGVIVAYLDPFVPAYGDLEIGDIITGLNDIEVDDRATLINEIEKITECDQSVYIKVIRNGQEKVIETALNKELDRCKIGISIYNHYEFNDPNFNILDDTGLGGSAGLLHTLMIYDKLTEHDLTYGKKISGTGGIDVTGNVTPIGGIKQKVMGAIKGEIDIYFAPDLDVTEGNLYQMALQVKKDLESDIIIVPVKTIDDAIDYLTTNLG